MGNSVVTGIFDAATSFRDPGSANVTSTAASTAVALDYMDNARGLYADTHGKMTYEINIVVSTLDETTADETYVATVRVGTNSGMSGATVVATLTLTEIGFYKVLVDRDTMEKALAAATHMDINMTLGGTTPILNYYAWVA